MKVLFITNIPSPYRVDFFNELGKNCKLTVTFEGKRAIDRNDKWIGEQAINYCAIYLNGFRTGIDNFFCLGILKVLREEWDKVIIGVYSTPTSMLAIEYLRLKKVPFYIESDGGFIKEDKKFKYLFKRHFVSAAAGWFSSGNATTDYLVHYGAEREKCFVYPFTSLKECDLMQAKKLMMKGKESYRKKLNMVEKKIVLSVGRFSYEAGYGKGYDTIMRVAERMSSNIGFYIVGDNPTKEFLEWKAEKKLENVHFIGFKNKSELTNYYASADVFILMTRGDVWGLVINEAMMYSLPIITTNKCIAGLELVDDKNGYILSVNDYANLKFRLETILTSDEIEDKLGMESLKRIQNYTIEEMAKYHIKFLQKGSQ